MRTNAFWNRSRTTPGNQQIQVQTACVIPIEKVLRVYLSWTSHDAYRNMQRLICWKEEQDNNNMNGFTVPECCICLYAMAPKQAFFIAPCQHAFHYKCARPLLDHYPGFLCPLCRSYADLEASVAIDTTEASIKKLSLSPFSLSTK